MHRPARRSLIHWLALLALLVNALLPGLAHAARHSNTSGPGADLCMTGSSQVPSDQVSVTGFNASDSSGQQHIGTDACCLYCLTHAATPWLPLLSEPSLPLLQPGAQTLAASPPSAGKARVCLDAYAARAPPAGHA